MEIKFTTEFVRLPDDVHTRTLPRAANNAGSASTRDPYREDGSWLQVFSQHVSIAVELSVELTGLYERFERATGHGGSAEAASAIAQEIGNRWELAWSQLDDARAIAAAHGATVSAYDKARDAARDLSSGAAIVEIGEWRDDGPGARRRTVQSRVPRLAPLRQALGGLRAAVPAAHVVRQPDAPDLRTLSQRIPWGWIVVALIAATAVVHFL